MRLLKRGARRYWPLGVLAAFGLSACGCFGGDEGLVREFDEPLSLQPANPGPASVSRMQKPDVVPVAAAIPELPPDAEAQVRILAMVGTTPVYESEVDEAVNQRVGELIELSPAAREAKRREIREEEFRRLIERELILSDMFEKLKKARPQILEELQEAANKEADKRFRDFRKLRNIPNDDAFAELLQAQGLSLKGMRRQIERNFMMAEYIRNLVMPKAARLSLGQVRDYYEAHPEEFRAEDRVKWQDLFVRADRFPSREEARRFAEQLANRARGGADFVALVKEYDQGDSVFRDGAGVGEKRGEIQPAVLEPVVFSLRAGEVGPVVEMAAGFHVVRVAERQYAGQKPFDVETQNEIRRKLQSQLGQAEYRRVIDGLRRQTPVVVFDR